jgi:peptidoglycan hydrolase-like protein with peptidoglycan-binding domain
LTSIVFGVRVRASLRRGTIAIALVSLLIAAAGTTVALADSPGAVAGAASSVVTVRKGDRGKAVKSVQRRLGLHADGVFGPLTHRAVKRFQKRRRLEADGIVGPLTRRAMRLQPFRASSVIRPRRRRSAPRDSGGGLPGLPRVLKRIAECESGGNPRAVSPNGMYRGKYQFMRSTWKANGGRTKDPIDASEAQQDRVALRLYRARGTAPWPSCG